jgi:hypothetical protein
VTVDYAAPSPTREWVCEILSHDISWLTDNNGEREYLVVVRTPRDPRDTEAHVVLRTLGTVAPTATWIADRTLSVAARSRTRTTQSKSGAGGRVTVIVRDEE